MSKKNSSKKNSAVQIFEDISKVCKFKKTGLHEPIFIGNEKKYLNECLSTTHVSSIGRFIEAFENKIKKLTKAKYAVAVANGTAALHLALLANKINSNDEVIVPCLSFVGTVNAVSYCNAIPHFVDIEEKTLGIDPDKLDKWLSKITTIKKGSLFNIKTRRKITAIIPVHVFGNPCKIQEISKIAKKYKLKVIEDAAESIGSFVGKKHTGTYGNIGIFSFNGNKTITTGGGGMVITNNKSFSDQIRSLSSTAKKKHAWNFDYDNIGFNYRLPNINAALGCAQIENLSKILAIKKKIHVKYKKIFKKYDNFKLLTPIENTISNYWINAIILKNKDKNLFQKILKITNSEGIQTRPSWKLLNLLTPYKKCPKSNLNTANSLQFRIINLPSGPNLS
tara:strand:- start:716 stop:1894 length:1179 start_codon:yes stop_codon:yes gene_type:complete